MSHTPAPWFCTFYEPRWRLIQTDREGGESEVVARVPLGGEREEANAKLIAAAPSLADALVNASGVIKILLSQLAQHEEGSIHADRALALADAALRLAGRLP